MPSNTSKTFIVILIGGFVGAIAGLVIAPIIGMLITGDSSTMAGKEQGFEGFLHGVYWGPLVGAVVGAVFAGGLGQRRR